MMSTAVSMHSQLSHCQRPLPFSSRNALKALLPERLPMRNSVISRGKPNSTTHIR